MIHRLALLLLLPAALPGKAGAQPPAADDIDLADPVSPGPELQARDADTIGPVEDSTAESDAGAPGGNTEGELASAVGATDAGSVSTPDAAEVSPTGDVWDFKVHGSGSAQPAAEPKPAAANEAVLSPPPEDGEAKLRALWAERQTAVRSATPRAVAEVEDRIAHLREDLGYNNHFAMAIAVAREAEGLSEANGAEALRRARFAAVLAPDLPSVHWTLAKIAFRDDWTNVSRTLGSSWDAIRATLSEPRWRGALLIDLGAASFASFLIAGGILIGLVFLRHGRYFLHDFHHLFPHGAWFPQTTALAAVALGLPIVVGPFFGLFGLALASWLFMRRGERVAIGIYLALLGPLSLGFAGVVRFAAFAGTPAELVYRLDRGEAVPPREESVLKALAEQRSPPFPVVFALGRSARRLGEAEHAAALLRQAAELNPSSSEALNELGNALALVGDLDGAAESFERAAQLGSARPGAYWLSVARLHTLKAERETDGAAVAGHAEKSQEAMRKVAAADPALAERARVVDHRANRFLTGTGLPTEALLPIARIDTDEKAVEQDVRRRLFGQVPASLAPVLPSLMVAVMALVGLLGGSLRPSEPCVKCGRPVCRRCDPALPGRGLCGQCVVAFSQQSAAEPSIRAAKEKSVRRHLRRREAAVKLAALMVAGAGHVLLGKTARGAALLLCFGFFGCLAVEHLLLHEGIARAPVGSAPLPVRAAPVLFALLALVAVSTRGAFAHFRAASPVEHSLGE